MTQAIIKNWKEMEKKPWVKYQIKIIREPPVLSLSKRLKGFLQIEIVFFTRHIDSRLLQSVVETDVV